MQLDFFAARPAFPLPWHLCADMAFQQAGVFFEGGSFDLVTLSTQ
jgi:hypothetical protein